MTYNLHPIFVHFPIALLTIYSIIKVLPLRKWLPRAIWRDVEGVLLFLGVLGAFAALATGDSAERLVRGDRPLVEMHSNFAVLSTWLYGILLAGFIASLLASVQALPQKVARFVSIISRVFHDGSFAKLIALLALISLFVTGLLGGVIVYGTSADPLASIVLKILGITL